VHQVIIDDSPDEEVVRQQIQLQLVRDGGWGQAFRRRRCINVRLAQKHNQWRMNGCPFAIEGRVELLVGLGKRLCDQSRLNVGRGGKRKKVDEGI
jgi:hypothetical protein